MNFYRQGPMRPSGPTMSIGVPGLTPMVKRLIIACAAVWGIQLVAGSFGLELGVYLGVCPYYVIRGWLWQPFTYMFLHSRDPFHLLFNMLMLWMFGGELERYWGSRAFLRYYLVCGIGAGLVTFLFNYLVIFRYFDQEIYGYVPVIGASGAIFGLFMAYGMIFAERTDYTEECVRFRIHCENFMDYLGGGGAVGRKLNLFSLFADNYYGPLMLNYFRMYFFYKWSSFIIPVAYDDMIF